MIILPHEQGSDAWIAARLSMPTASRASSLITSDGKASSDGALRTYAEDLATEALTGRPLYEGGTADTDRGHVLEPAAVREYQRIRGVGVERVGLCTDDAGRYGGSPDGLVGTDGGVEIKTAKVGKHTHVILDRLRLGSPPPEHIAQCRQLMAVTGRAWWDLMLWSWSSELPSVIWRIERDSDIETLLLMRIKQCIAERDRAIKTLRGLFDAPAQVAA